MAQPQKKETVVFYTYKAGSWVNLINTMKVFHIVNNSFVNNRIQLLLSSLPILEDLQNCRGNRQSWENSRKSAIAPGSTSLLWKNTTGSVFTLSYLGVWPRIPVN